MIKMDPKMRKNIKDRWQEVKETVGQPLINKKLLPAGTMKKIGINVDALNHPHSQVPPYIIEETLENGKIITHQAWNFTANESMTGVLTKKQIQGCGSTVNILRAHMVTFGSVTLDLD